MKNGTLSRHHPRQSVWLNLLLAAATALLGTGIFAPMLTVEKFFVFSDTVSLVSGLVDLAISGEWFLFGLIGAFSVLLPVFKLGLLFVVWNVDPAGSDRHVTKMRWMSQWGKWSMLDVFVVAIFLVSVKLGSIARVEVHFGVYAFAASVLLTMVLNQWVLKLSHPESVVEDSASPR
jgi:paraquat-inducible protein A